MSGKTVKKWLITGGCGFIGLNLLSKLKCEGGNFVRIVDNLAVGSPGDLAGISEFAEVGAGSLSESPQPGEVELVVGDITDDGLALKIVDNIDIIVHLAANTGVAPSVEDPRYDCLTNVIGTLNYLEAARLSEVKRFVFASSGAPVGECEPPIHEELPPHPVSPYGASKLAGEGYCSAYFRSFGVETVCLRFSNVYGPYSAKKSSIVAKFVRKSIKSQPLEIYGDGKQTRDFIHVDDLVDAIILSATREGIGGEIFQVATNQETSVSVLADKLNALVAEFCPGSYSKIEHSGPRVGDVTRNFSDVSKAKEVLGWSPKIELDDGLREVVRWFVENK